MKSGVPSIWPSRVKAAVGLALAGHLGQAEVEHFDVALSPSRASIRLPGLMSRWTMPLLVGVLKTKGRLIHEVAGVCHRHRPLSLDELGEVVALDVLHGKDDAVADTEGRVRRDDVRVAQLGGGPDLAQEAVEHPGRLMS